MIIKLLENSNFGRGCYDTTGVPKPPLPKPRNNPKFFEDWINSLSKSQNSAPHFSIQNA